jgi:hypothetical protein
MTILRLVFAVLLATNADGAASSITPAGAPLEGTLRACEREMEQHPRDAFLIARRTVDMFSRREEVVKRLFTTAARLQEERLMKLGEPQVVELAEVYRKTLQDDRSARRVEQAWLQKRMDGLGDGSATERLHLAGLYWAWLKDRARAARLCQEALQAAPQLTGAAQMLIDDLHYRRTETGWVPVEGAKEAVTEVAQRLRPGMSPEEVKKLLGPPNRMARQVLYRRYLEQWIYDGTTPLTVEFSSLKGQDPQLLGVHDVSPAKR